jgi:alpha-D-ribose 1-methylphosphonate 5-triphosphate synthase subunit PhnH
MQHEQRRREVHESKLREGLAKKEMRFHSYAERLERRSGAQFASATDGEQLEQVLLIRL